MIKYYFNNLSSYEFQRLINTLLISEFGENVRLTPLQGKDGGRDGETAAGNPFFPAVAQIPLPATLRPGDVPQRGRYLFQVKHHGTSDARPQDIRNVVVADFKNELKENVITRKGDEKVNYFLLMTNVSSSDSALNKIDEVRREVQIDHPSLHADVWWQEHITALLDIYPRTWSAFPNLFAGNMVPMIAKVSESGEQNEETPASVRAALAKHFKRDSQVKFQQIDLQNDILKLFVDLEVNVAGKNTSLKKEFLSDYWSTKNSSIKINDALSSGFSEQFDLIDEEELSAVRSLLVEPKQRGYRLIVEGGPGQGKSTVTQVVAQLHRSYLLNRPLNSTPLPQPKKVRVPFRIELRLLAEWVSSVGGSVEQYICKQITEDSGGNEIGVKEFHQFAQGSRLLLIFDGLDEIGSDELKEKCISLVEDCIVRLEEAAKADLQVIITTRPPAFSNFENRFTDFVRLRVQPMNEDTVEKYVSQWLKAQGVEEEVIEQIGRTFEIRSQETHVSALSKNPMQLSVLLHFIRLKGAAFPSKRAELYREYFKVVIDRDVAKTPELAGRREIIELLHQFLGYKIHALTEVDETDGSISYSYLVDLVNNWLRRSGADGEDASTLVKVGEERLGLLVATKGEGASTHYGFEIQPIREYFAAAYISNQALGDAHICFEQLIVRPFWHEVSLFLAGLSRNNEKADLIARAIATDQNYENTLIRPGINVILQLAEEGVFDQPPHLFNQAINYLLDSLDGQKKLLCALSSDHFEKMLKLIKDHKTPKILELIKQKRDENLKTQDDSLLLSSSRFSAQLLDPLSTINFNYGIFDRHPVTLSQLRLQPLQFGIDITEL